MDAIVLLPPFPAGRDAPSAEADPRLAIASLTAALGAAARRVRRRGDDQAVHDLRVACRRLEATLWLWKPWLEERLAASLRAGVRRLRRRLSEARDAEVAVDLLERDEAAKAPARPPRVERWLERRRRLRDRWRQRAARLARRRWIERIESQAAMLSAAMTPPASGARAEVRDRLERRIAALLQRIESPQRRLHELRIAVKQCRYTLESWTAVTASPALLEVSSLTAVQRRLGRLRDAQLLSQRLAVREQRWCASGRVSAQRWASQRRDALQLEVAADQRALPTEWNALLEQHVHRSAPASR